MNKEDSLRLSEQCDHPAGCFLAVMAPEMSSFHPQAAGGETGRARQPKRTRPAWQEAPEWAIGLGMASS